MLKKAFQQEAFISRAKSKFLGMPIGTFIFCPCLFFPSSLPSPLTHTYNTQVKLEELTLLAKTAGLGPHPLQRHPHEMLFPIISALPPNRDKSLLP